MPTEPEPSALGAALASYDRNSAEQAVEAAASERVDMLERFPRSGWPGMELEAYAQGQADSSQTLCRWIEFQTPHLGSIRGGSARKLIVYKHAQKPGWYFPPAYENERDAWEAVRAGFIEAFEAAEGGEWHTIDDIAALQPGPALLLKLLFLYHPDEVLPICSQDHLRKFLAVVGSPEAEDQNLGAVRLNRALLAALRDVPEVADWSTKELERLLYRKFRPSAPQVYKIAPGRDAKYWEDCLDGGFICVGWDQIGDLRQFESKEAFLEAWHVAAAEDHSAKSKRTEKGNELWRLMDLVPGDLIVANHGTSKILGVGTVVEPGYTWDGSRAEFRHTVPVSWDTSYAKEITAQKRWALVTIAVIPKDLQAELLHDGEGSVEESVAGGPPDEKFKEIAASIERKGQAVLYGPPGTGKTWTANRFADWWLNEKNGSTAESQPGAQARSAGAWWVVASPDEWSWDELFKTGEVVFRRGKLKKNYPLIRQGQLVIGYEATPTKRIVALARVSRVVAGEDGPTFALTPLTRVSNGLTWAELKSDDQLSRSEPVANNCQGTLFALSADEIGRVLSLLAERDGEIQPFADQEWPLDPSQPPNELTRITFHPSYSYEDFVEGFRPVEGSGDSLRLALEDGVFKQVCREAAANRDKTFLVLIDEINRANIAKVFGELITLLEKDKRGMEVRLPQSKQTFAIPPNVYVLGTMNTADRSIKLLDAALRRRFAFIELMPDLSLFEGATVGGLALDAFLGSLNRAIAKGVGREKQIGHSFFLKGEQPISDPSEFTLVFRQEIVPLLQEYFYEEYSDLAEYLGDKLVDAEAQVLKHDALADPDALLAALEQKYKPELADGE